MPLAGVLSRLSLTCLTVFVHDGLLVSVLTSHSLTCSAVLVHTTFGLLDHAMSVLLFLCGFRILSLASISGASGCKLTSETNGRIVTRPFPATILCVVYVSLYCARLPDHVPSTKPRHFGAEAKRN